MANKKTDNKFDKPERMKGRAMPLVPKAGYTKTKRRYCNGGKLKK